MEKEGKVMSLSQESPPSGLRLGCRLSHPGGSVCGRPLDVPITGAAIGAPKESMVRGADIGIVVVYG